MPRDDDSIIELAKRGESGWVTIDGVHVHIDGKTGRIDKGPDHMEGKTPAEVDGGGKAKAKGKGKEDYWETATAEAQMRVQAIDSIRGGAAVSSEGADRAQADRIAHNKAATAKAAAERRPPAKSDDDGGHTKSDEPAEHKTATAKTVKAVHDEMDQKGGVSQERIDHVVSQLKAMPEADVLAGAKELGIVGAGTKGKAIAAIRTNLINQAEAAAKVDAIGHHRMSRDAYYLSTAPAADPVTPATPAGPGLPTSVAVKIGERDVAVPVAYFWKDAIAAGDYVHPATKQRLSVDGRRIDGWVSNFHAMRKAGIEIPTPADHKPGALNNLGFVVDAKREGDRLRLLHQVIGDDAAMAAIRNRCSLCIDPDFRDERGRAWGDCFTHNAYTPNPVVTGMGQFVPFLASRDGAGETPVYYLSAEDRTETMDMKPLREALGVAADVTDDKIIDAAKALRTAADADAAKVKELTGTVAQLSRKPAEPDPEMLRDRADLTVGRIDLAVAAGDLPPTVAAKLKASVNPKAPNAFMLSRHDGIDARPVDYVLGLFAGEKLGGPKAGSVTNPHELARTVPGEADADKPVTPERMKELLGATPTGRSVIDAAK